MATVDSNGNAFVDGDSAVVIKMLKVKGSSMTIKQGTMVKNIKLTDDESEIECKVDKTKMVLRTEFLRKA